MICPSICKVSFLFLPGTEKPMTVKRLLASGDGPENSHEQLGSVLERAWSREFRQQALHCWGAGAERDLEGKEVEPQLLALSRQVGR